MNPKFRWIAALVAAVALMDGCGGGGGGAQSGGIGGTGVVSKGVMTKGSVILNGVHFSDTSATIVIDDQPKTSADLKSGMVVQVKGHLFDSGGGTAERVEAQVEVRGAAVVTQNGVDARPQTFVVLGQTVIVNDQTIVHGSITNPITIALNSTLVEIFGLRDSTGTILATRIESDAAQMAISSEDEIRGVVSLLSGATFPATFKIGNQEVLINDASLISPAGAALADGAVVEVHCSSRPCVVSNQFVAGRVDVEDLEDAAFQPSAGGRLEVEGLVSNISGGTTTSLGSFFVGDVPVSASGSTEVEGGTIGDFGPGLNVEVEGTWNGFTLVATKVKFERPVIRLQGKVPSAPSGRTFGIQVANLPVMAIEVPDGLTLPTGGEPCIEVRGQRKAGGTLAIVAAEINFSCGNSGRHLIQAPVEAKSPEISITLLGFSINVSSPIESPPNQWLNTDGLGISRTTFFNTVVPATVGPPSVAGTLVKVIFDDAPSTAVRQVELED